MIQMKGRSNFTLEIVDARLLQLQARPEPHDEETQREIVYLTELRARKFPDAQPIRAGR
jgi:hypothetical protein